MTLLPFGQVAPISRRAVAYVIDALIAGGLGVVLGGGLLVAASLAGGLEGTLTTLMIGGPIVSLVLLAWFFVYTVMQAGNGSIGMRAQGLRLASAVDGTPVGFGRALLRNVIFGLAGAIVVGYFSPLFDGSGRFQGWHDKVGNALMLDDRVEAPAESGTPAPASGVPTSLASAAPAAAFATSAAPVVPGLPHPAPRTGAPFAPPAAAPTTGFAQPAPPAPVASSASAPVAPQPVSAPAAPAPAVPTPAAPAAPIPDAGDLIAFVPGITQDSAPARVAAAPEQAPPAPAPAPVPPAPVAPAPVPAAPPAAAPAPVPIPAPATPAFDAEESDIEDTRISIPGHRLVFTWDDGTRVSVSRRTIFGRNPGPEDGAIIVSVRDETLSLSKTHFEAAAEVSGGWVLDRHSTNGMTIVREGQRIACPAGQRVPVRLGDAIEIGDRIVTIGGYA